MRFGYIKSRDLEGAATLRDWLFAQIDAAELVAPDYEEIVFILPVVGTRFRLIDKTSIPAFRKKIKSNVGLGVTATRNAKKLAGMI